VKAKPEEPMAMITEGPLEKMKGFGYFGSFIYSDRNINTVSARISLAAQAFKELEYCWKYTANQIEDVLVKLPVSTSLYSRDMKNRKLGSKLRGVKGRCLRRTLKIGWQEKVKKEEVRRCAGVNNIVMEVKRRRWTRLGHVLHIKKERGKRHGGRPHGTW
jgi:hypothetical protein